MSREAMEAVQDHSAISDPTGLAVFLAIARFVGPDGSPGWASYRTLADVAHCDKDTVSRWVGLIEETGEMSIRKEGRGRGTRMYYTINLPFNDPKHGGAGSGDNNQRMSQSGGDNNMGTIIETLSQKVELLSQQIELLSQQLELLSPLLSQNVPTREGQKPETIEKPKKPVRIYNGVAEDVETTNSKSDEYHAMHAAICSVVKTTFVPHQNAGEFEGAALAFLRDGITTEQVDEFGKWWSEHGYYTGKPALKTLVDEIKNSLPPDARASPKTEGMSLVAPDGTKYVVKDGQTKRVETNA